MQSSVDTSTSEGKVKIDKAQSKLNEKQLEVTTLQTEVNRLSEKLAKNLRDNQADLFGNNKTQSLFDDKADQQKIFDDKVSELCEAQKDLVKAKQELADLKETEGQVELTMPESKVEIDCNETDLSKTDEDTDAKIISQSIFNPLKLISEAQKFIDRTENRFTEKFVPKVTDYVAEKLKAWRQSKSTAKQYASSYASSIFGGIDRTSKNIDVKLGLISVKRNWLKFRKNLMI
ncbi:hypothetical protein WG904_03440 [Pedobacter sp. Du54]|uniref:hypothetical protein n=1 Tax=Pedobacter anseongensis TaxID=3133439 RepID=UPI0030966A88